MAKKKTSDLLESSSEDTTQAATERALAAVKGFLADESEFGIPRWYLSTGNLALDYIISGRVDGTGGWPGGRLVEIFGDPSTGKSLLIAMAIKQMQDTGGLIALADVENRWDSDFARIHGVDQDKIAPLVPRTIEEFGVISIDLLEACIREKVPRVLLCLDSVAALSTEWELENKGMKEDQGKRAKKLHAVVGRVLPGLLAKANGLMVVSNHIIQNPQITYGSNRMTPGGKALPFQSSVRLELLSTEKIKLEKKERVIGNTLHCVCAKNSIQPPFGEAFVDLYWAQGVDKYSGLLRIAKDIEVIEQNGAWYTFQGQNFRGDDFGIFIESHPEVLQHEAWTSPYFKRR